MRNFDNWVSYLDNDDKLFFGRFKFYKLGTTDLADIYSPDGERLENPLYSDAHGKTSTPVWLGDQSYTVVMDKYIGSGDMDLSVDSSDWAEVRSFDNLYPTNTLELISSSVPAFATIDDLRNATLTLIPTVAPGADRYVQLLGYYEEGDKPAVYYKLETDNVSVEDGGAIIRTDPTHVWKLIHGDCIDVRDYGVFPAEDYLDITPFNSQLRLCFTYANSKGINVYVPQVYATGGYYQLEGGIFNLSATLLTDSKTMISGKPGTSSTLDVRHISHTGYNAIFTQAAGTGTIVIKTSKLHSSWFDASWTTLESGSVIDTMIIDGYVRSGVFDIKNCNVEVTELLKSTSSNTYTLYFTSCNISSAGFIHDATCVFDSCGEVSEYWFNDDSVVSQVSNCVILPQNCKSCDTYITWKNLQSEYNYGPCGGLVCINKSACVVQDGGVISDCSGSLTIAGSANVSNFSGSIKLLTSASNTLTISNATVNFVESILLPNLSLTNVTLSSSLSLTCSTSTTLSVSGGSIGTSINMSNVSTAYISDCTISAACTVRNAVFSKCNIFSVITELPTADTNTFGSSFIGCIFGASGKHLNSCTTANIICNNKWVNNVSTTGLHPQEFSNPSNLLSGDANHAYVYSGNTGGWLPHEHNVLVKLPANTPISLSLVNLSFFAVSQAVSAAFKLEVIDNNDYGGTDAATDKLYTDVTAYPWNINAYSVWHGRGLATTLESGVDQDTMVVFSMKRSSR